MADEKRGASLGVHVLCVLIIGVLFSFGFFRWRYYEEKIGVIAECRDDYEAQLQVFQDREERRANMERTLIINFGLSTYESHYYSIMFDEFSQKYDVPWEVYPAIIRIESNFRTTLKSAKGAKGIGQMLESTAEEVADKLGVKFVKGETLWNEILNMVFSLTYLSEAIQDSGCVEHGMKVYLGGPGYAKNMKRNNSVYAYIGSYKTSVWQEYIRLQYIYKGVSSETPVILDNIQTPADSLEVDSIFR